MFAIDKKDVSSLDAVQQARYYVAPFIANLSSFMDNPFALSSYVPRMTDVVLNSYPKAGTVMLQQMCYQIAVLSGGAPANDPTGMDFDDIATAVPWIEQMERLKMPDSKTMPRIFKSHMPVDAFERNASKHIVVSRNPRSFSASFLNFFFPTLYPDLLNLTDDVKQACVEQVFEQFILKETGEDGIGTWHAHIKRSLTQSPNVMVLFYEDVVDDMKGAVEKIARFMDCHLSDTDIQTVVHRCDRKYMSTDPKFEGRFEKEGLGLRSNPVHTFPEDYVGFKKFPIPSHLIERLEKMNVKVFGLKTYEEIKEKIMSEQEKIHFRR